MGHRTFPGGCNRRRVHRERGTDNHAVTVAWTATSSDCADIGLLIIGVFANSYIDNQAWKAAGQQAGLSPTGNSNPFDEPDLGGVVQGRQVRAHTRSEGGGEDDTSRTYTVVEMELATPVEWSATFRPDSADSASRLDEIDSSQWTTIDDRIPVVGDIPEARARAVLSGPAKAAITSLGSVVSVGDTEQNHRKAMLDTMPDETEGAAQNLAEGMLQMGMDGDTAGPTTAVRHSARGLVRDGAELKRRAEAVVEVANAVEQTATTPQQ